MRSSTKSFYHGEEGGNESLISIEFPVMKDFPTGAAQTIIKVTLN